jgi:hypothetical protein
MTLVMDDYTLSRAVLCARVAFGHQRDKSGQPKIGHSLRVMAYVSPDVAEMVLAVTHDLIEDTPLTLEHVARTVLMPDYLVRALDIITRKPDQKYWDYIDLCADNEAARAVKIADLYDNCDPDRWTPDIKEWSRGMIRGRYIKALERLGGPRLPHDWLERIHD